MKDLKSTKPTVLVVDDDQPTVDALKEVLEDAGYHVATAAHGNQAMDYLHRARVPDVILTDLMMPVMDGWSLSSQVRSEPKLSGTPIVVMTAGGAGMLATAPVASGYLKKPLDVNTLLGVLRRTIDLHARNLDPASSN